MIRILFLLFLPTKEALAQSAAFFLWRLQKQVSACGRWLDAKNGQRLRRSAPRGPIAAVAAL